jgi:DNA-binding response OmpR family regulator
MADIVAFPQDGSDGCRHTILIVDDEPVIRGFLCDYLSQAGFLALAVASGDDAAALLDKGTSIDLVFSDVRMPGRLDGFGLARWIREHRPNLPVLLASGELGKRGVPADLYGAEIMPKPYDIPLVIRRMHAALENHSRRSA